MTIQVTRPPLKIQEEDGAPAGFPHTLKVTNATLTDNGDGTFSLAISAGLDTIYLKLDASNDPLTGELTITPASGTTALTANKAIVLKAGEKLYFDGA